jgi:membrane-bound lytic murein transglycosylase D
LGHGHPLAWELDLRRILSLLAVGLVTGCGGPHRPPAAAPEPARGELPAAPAEAPGGDLPTITDALLLPPAPSLDTLVPPEELAAELRLAADSAADQAVLEALEDAAPIEDDASDESVASTPVTWDIDVDTYTGHDRVQYYLDFFQGKGRERMGIWLSRLPRYEGMIRTRLQEQGLPGDLVYLALIESGFSNTATSRAKAVGMWQFMKGTARGYGLRVDSWVDERRDPYKATIAAARHLKNLDDRFGSVYMAAAAYNAGAGKVSRGVRRLPDDEADSVTSDATFFRLYDTKLLRRETKDYVPKLIAAARIAKEPGRYGFTIDSVEPSAYDSIVVPTMTGLDVVARLADTTVAAIREMNPQYLRLATPPGAASVVRIPYGRGAATEAAYAELPPSRRITFVEHTVARGETMSGIAHRYRVSQRLLTEANPRLHGRVLRPGMNVIVPTGGALSTSVARRVADPVEPASGRPGGFHLVRRGETLADLAQQYGVSEQQLRRWNVLGRTERIRAGQRLRVAARGAQAVSASGPAGDHRVHTVQRGETLTGLARRYGVSVQALRAANGLSRGEDIRAGLTLRIPG